jgi:hypothetical protein
MEGQQQGTEKKTVCMVDIHPSLYCDNIDLLCIKNRGVTFLWHILIYISDCIKMSFMNYITYVCYGYL